MSPLDLMRAVRAARGLSPCEKAVLFCLSTYANTDGGGCWPSIDTITDDTAWSRSKVAEARASLVARGVLIRQGFTTSGTVCFAIAIPVVVALAGAAPIRGTRPAKGGKARLSPTPIVRPTDSTEDAEGSAPRTGESAPRTTGVRPTDEGGPPGVHEGAIDLALEGASEGAIASAPAPAPAPKAKATRKPKAEPYTPEDWFSLLGAVAELGPDHADIARKVLAGSLKGATGELVGLLNARGPVVAIRRVRFVARGMDDGFWGRCGSDLSMLLKHASGFTGPLDTRAEIAATKGATSLRLAQETDPRWVDPGWSPTRRVEPTPTGPPRQAAPESIAERAARVAALARTKLEERDAARHHRHDPDDLRALGGGWDEAARIVEGR